MMIIVSKPVSLKDLTKYLFYKVDFIDFFMEYLFWVFIYFFDVYDIYL